MAIALVVYFGQSTMATASSHEMPAVPAANMSNSVSAIETPGMPVPAGMDPMNNSTALPTDTVQPSDQPSKAMSGGPPSGMKPPSGSPPSGFKPPGNGEMPGGTPPSGTNGATASVTPSVTPSGMPSGGMPSGTPGGMTNGKSNGLSTSTTGTGSIFGSSTNSMFGTKATATPSASSSGLSLYNYAASVKPTMTSLFGHS